MTFSVVARARATGSSDEVEWGIATASAFLAIGNATPAAVAGVGAIATQARINVAWKGIALGLLDEGATASVAVQRMIEEDADRDHRQVALVDLDGGTAWHTGRACPEHAGALAGDGVVVLGNILPGPGVLEAMLEAWGEGEDQPLADRLLAVLRAGENAGGDRRGTRSAALLVVRDGAGYGGLDDVAADLRVDDHDDPVGELARLHELDTAHRAAYADHEAWLDEHRDQHRDQHPTDRRDP